MTTLADLVHVEANWTRSVNVEKDAVGWSTGDIPYTLTPLARWILDQAVIGLANPKAARAFTITGSYGTGKSAFALALSHLLSPAGPNSQLAREVEIEDPELAAKLQQVWSTGVHPVSVMVNGRRGALIPALAGALRKALRAKKPSAQGVRDLIRRLDALDPSDAAGLTGIFEETAAEVGCVLLVIDELGKFLEFAAQSPSQGDIFVLQLLAESAARSGNTPFLVFGILHQAFSRYGASLTRTQREEFGKVQGRFQDIAFNQSHDLMLRLVSKTLVPATKSPLSNLLYSNARAISQDTVGLGLGLRGIAKEEAVELLTSCAPLHPVTALLLGPLFRRLAQNERSLFTFVSSPEPFGLREFLQRTPVGPNTVALYTPDALYDYVTASLGTALYQDVGGRRWSQVEATLDRLRDGTPLEVHIVKAVGLLVAVGESGGLPATPDVITLCFPEAAGEVRDTLKRLTKRKILVYRSFVNAYRLWEGSDLDIEERLVDARAFVDEGKGLAQLLASTMPQRPIVARRHSFETGTLRFFEVEYADYRDATGAVGQRSVSDADGRVLYILSESPAQRHELVQRLEEQRTELDEFTVVVPLHLPAVLHGAALELERLKWVRENTPELSGDLVAQRELRSRLYETEQILRREIERALSLGSSELTCVWRGTATPVRGMRGLNQFLSRVADSVYSKAPVIQNELVNRRQLSSAAAAARRLLLQAMLEHCDVHQLGITGHPPQLSMYLSLLSRTGLHVSVGGDRYAFVSPPPGSSLGGIWEVWRSFLSGCRAQRRSLAELWSELASPPLGLRDGVIPVLILAMLLERSAEIGIYESGSFIAEVTLAHVERFVRTPAKFDIRYTPMDGLRLEFFSELSKALGRKGIETLVPLVRALVLSVAKLPPFSQKTLSLPEQARRVRGILMSAREPDVMLFKDLPEALGHADMLNGDPSPEQLSPFIKDLIDVLGQLNHAYRRLLDRILRLTLNALRLPDDPVGAFAQLGQSVRAVRGLSIDLRMKGFLDHLVPPDAPALLDGWLEALASYVASRPPATWNDSDMARFETELAVLAQRFRALRDIAFHRGYFGEAKSGDALRLGLVNAQGEELFTVVSLDSGQLARAEKLGKALDHLLLKHNLVSKDEQLAALAVLTRKLLEGQESA